MTDIRGLTVRDCREFYRSHYAPSNATLVIAGDFDERKALTLVQKHYGDLPGTRAATSVAAPREPAQRAERNVQLHAPTPTEKILLGYHAPAYCDPDSPALNVASEVLFGGRSSRIHRLFCLEKEIALSVRGSISPFVDPGLFEMWLFVREGKRRADALALLNTELEKIAVTGPTKVELDKAIHQLELSFLHGLETAGGKAEQIGFHEMVANDGAAVFSRIDDYRAVRIDDVKRVVRKYLRPSRRTRVEIVPSRP